MGCWRNVSLGTASAQRASRNGTRCAGAEARPDLMMEAGGWIDLVAISSYS